MFRGVRQVDDYLRRCIRFLGAEQTQNVAQAIRSPLDLSEALGYLDVVWRLRFGSALLGRTKPAAAARLSLPCSGGDEFDSRLSALADVLGQLTVELPAAEAEAKKHKEKSLARMKRRIGLDPELTGEARTRIDEAIDTLRRAVRIRVSGQHSGVGGEVAESFASLGVRYPPGDLGDAWEEIRSRCATAVDAIRQELEAEEFAD
jgi:hypothetical protein